MLLLITNRKWHIGFQWHKNIDFRWSWRPLTTSTVGSPSDSWASCCCISKYNVRNINSGLYTALTLVCSWSLWPWLFVAVCRRRSHATQSRMQPSLSAPHHPMYLVTQHTVGLHSHYTRIRVLSTYASVNVRSSSQFSLGQCSQHFIVFVSTFADPWTTSAASNRQAGWDGWGRD